MSFAEEMTGLGEKLLASCENRVFGNAEMTRDTEKLIKRFHFNNKQMGKNLRNNLSNYGVNLSSSVSKLLRRFKSQRKEMAKNQREQLGEFTSNLSRNVGGFIRKCHKNRMGLHNMFVQAHKNFTRIMGEIGRKKSQSPTLKNDGPITPQQSKRGKRKRTVH